MLRVLNVNVSEETLNVLQVRCGQSFCPPHRGTSFQKIPGLNLISERRVILSCETRVGSCRK